MSKDLYFLKQLESIDDEINKCIKNIADLFGSIENLTGNLNVVNSDNIDSEAFKDVLNKLITSLNSSSGVEEYIIPHLGELFRYNGIKLLEINSSQLINDERNTNIETENKETDNTSFLWNSICNHLEQYSQQLLNKNYKALFSLCTFNLNQLQMHVSLLQNIYIPEMVWQKLKHFHISYLQTFNCKCLTNGACLNCYLKLCRQNIFEDQYLIHYGHFHPLIFTQMNILEIYLKHIQQSFLKFIKTMEHFRKARRNIPQEIMSVLLSFKEIYCRYSNTCFYCHYQSILIGEIESYIGQFHENSLNEIHQSLIFSFILIKLVELLSKYDYSIDYIFNNETDTSPFHLHEEDITLLHKDIKINLPNESPEHSPERASQSTSLLTEESCCFSKFWKVKFVENGYLIELQRLLEKNIQAVLKSSIEKEVRCLQTNHWKDLVSIENHSKFLSTEIQLNAILLSVHETVKELERFLPVLVASNGAFSSFKLSFCHTVDSYLIDLLKHLESIAQYRNGQFPIYYIYIAATNTLFLMNRLQFYMGFLDDVVLPECDSPLNNIWNSISSQANDLIEKIFLYHSKYISCGILFDADSYNFDDKKAFFEGERISYSIQMWNVYMKGMLTDLSYFMPQNVAQEMYARVLASSLQHFLIRYAHASPSEARTPQVQQDIMVLLLCASELLCPACSSVSEITGRIIEMDESTIISYLNNIHSSCCSLLSVLIVLTSPIMELFKIFKNGFPQPKLSMLAKYESMASWLPWIRKELFPEFSQSRMMSNVSVWLTIKPCTKWNVPNPSTIIRAYVDHNCMLSILLMTQTATASDCHREGNCNLLQEISLDPKVKFAYSVYEIMSCYNYNYSLGDILLPVIEKSNGWSEFDSSSLNKSLNDRPWWFFGLIKLVEPYFKSIFEALIPLQVKLKSRSKDKKVIDNWLEIRNDLKQFIKCSCDNDLFNSFDDDDASDEIVSFMCLKKLLECIYKNLNALPQVFRYCLVILDIHLMNYVPEVQPLHNSLPLQVLLSMAITFLNAKTFEKWTGHFDNFIRFTTSAMNLFLLNQDSSICEVYKQQLKTQLSLIKREFKYLKKDIEKNAKTFPTEEMKDEEFTLASSKLMQKLHGEDIILYMHKILRQNEAWIQTNLGIQKMLSTDMVVNSISPSPLFNCPSEVLDNRQRYSIQSSSFHKFSIAEPIEEGSLLEHHRGSYESVLSSKPYIDESLNAFCNSGFEIQDSTCKLELNMDESSNIQELEFNILNHYEELGASTFSQVATEQFALPWEAIISHLPVLGLTEINFNVLLKQRWDVRNEGPLTTEEAECIEKLKKMYLQI